MATNTTLLPVGTRWCSEWGGRSGAGPGERRGVLLPQRAEPAAPQPRLHLPLIPLRQAAAGDALCAPLLTRHHALAQYLQGESPAPAPTDHTHSRVPQITAIPTHPQTTPTQSLGLQATPSFKAHPRSPAAPGPRPLQGPSALPCGAARCPHLSSSFPFRTALTTGASLRGWPITSTTLSTRPPVSASDAPSRSPRPLARLSCPPLCFLCSLRSSAG